MSALTTKPVTMSSREIAKLTGKEHKNVLRDIREMLDALEKDGSDLSHVREDKDARGYTKQFHLDRELTETLVTGYSIPLRHKVIRRIHELEQKVSDHTPAIAADMQDTVSALLLIGEAIKQVPGIKPGIAMACTLSMIEVNTGLDVTEARKALPAKNDPACDLNATALGKLAGMSGKAANLALAGAGLQVKNDRGDWELTEAGRKWAEALPFERRGHAGYQILWNRDVLGVLGLDEPGPKAA